MADMYMCLNDKCPEGSSCADRKPHLKGSYCDKPGHYATNPNIYCPACTNITCKTCDGKGYCIPWKHTVKIAIDHTKVVGMDESCIPVPSPSEPTCPNCKAMREALYSAQNLLDSHGYNKKNSKVMREIDQALRGGTR